MIEEPLLFSSTHAKTQFKRRLIVSWGLNTEHSQAQSGSGHSKN